MNRTSKSQSHSLPLIQSLETRRLLSGSWTTIEEYNPAPDHGVYYDVAADAAGNVYAVGERDASNGEHGIVREKPAGSATWITLLDNYNPPELSSGFGFNSVAVTPTGDLYVSGSSEYNGWVVLERPAGQSEFSVVDVPPTSWKVNADLTVDSAGNVFAVGEAPVQATITVNHKTTTVSERGWVVRERRVGASSFSTVDQFLYSPSSPNPTNSPYAVTAGPGGIYVVGSADTGGGSPVEHWIVRKSADGGTTWATVDDYQWDPAATSRAEGITADAQGNVYVSGESVQRYVISTSKRGTTYGYRTQWEVRKSTNGGVSWASGGAVSIPGLSSEAVGFGMGTDADGNVYAATPSYDAVGVAHSVIRGSSVGWQAVDDFQLSPGQDSLGIGFASGPDGALYACGYGWGADGLLHGFVRSQPASALAAPATAPVAPLFSTTWIGKTADDSTDVFSD